MILQSLVELATNERLVADPDFEFKPVAWIVRIQGDGSLVSVQDNRINLNVGKADKRGKPVKAKWVGLDVSVPIQSIRTSGDAEAFLVDKADYVFGVDPAGKRPSAKLASRMRLFYLAIEKCAAAEPDPSTKAVVSFGRTLSALTQESRAAYLPKDCGPSDLIMFRVGNDQDPVQLRPSARAYWKSIRNPVIVKGSESLTAGVSRVPRSCLITGRPMTGDVGLFRLLKNVPGGTSSGVSLLSFNAPAWKSHGWNGNENATFSRDAAEAAATALNRLLDPSPRNGAGESLPIRHVRLSEDTVVVFWSPTSTREVQSLLDLVPDLLEPNDDLVDVANLLASPKVGFPRELHAPALFYAMTLTGTQGRAIVRDWLEETVTGIQENLHRHFDSIACVRNTPQVQGSPLRTVLPLRDLMSALAANGRDAKVPAALAAGFVHAALRNSPYPRSILQRSLLRERAEAADSSWGAHARRDARASLIKAVLTRDPEFKTNLEIQMDENRTEAGYLLGRLMAVLEETQRLASGGVNASVKDKFYGAASATPAAVFPTMMDMFHKHVRKGREKRPGAITNREKLVDVILSKLNTIPVHLDLKEQGLFVLGYHHQRHALFNKRDSNKNRNNETTDVLPATKGAPLEHTCH